MAYTTTTSIKDRPGAVIAVIGIHALIGYGLVTGLAGGIIEEVFDENPDAIVIPENIPPPPPTPKESAEPSVSTAPPIPAPKPPIDFTRDSPIPVQDIPIPDITFTDPIVRDLGPVTLPSPAGDAVVPKPSPVPSFTPTAASPKNSGWVRDSDYRSRWIREELTGVASFKLGIGTNGRVTDCAITKSSGHNVLDQATCSLIEKRARFDAAKDANGKRTAGTFTGSIQWVLPE